MSVPYRKAAGGTGPWWARWCWRWSWGQWAWSCSLPSSVPLQSYWQWLPLVASDRLVTPEQSTAAWVEIIRVELINILITKTIITIFFPLHNIHHTTPRQTISPPDLILKSLSLSWSLLRNSGWCLASWWKLNSRHSTRENSRLTPPSRASVAASPSGGRGITSCRHTHTYTHGLIKFLVPYNTRQGILIPFYPSNSLSDSLEECLWYSVTLNSIFYSLW